MKRKITLLCLFTAGATLTAFAEVGDKITSLEQLSNSKCYTITPQDNGRGTWLFDASEPNFLWSTGKKGVAVDATAPAQQFAFIKSESGKYYVYSIGAQKFLSYTTTPEKTVALVQDLNSIDAEASFAASTSDLKNDYPWVVALNGHHIGISNNYTYGVITFYQSTNDGGNCISITEAGDFDPTAAIEKIEAYETMYSDENKALLAEGQKYLNTPEGFVGSYDPALVQALKAVCGEDGVLDLLEAISPAGKQAIENLRAATPTVAELSNGKVYKIRNMNESNGFLVSIAEEGKSRIYGSTRQNITPIEGTEYWQVVSGYGYTFLYNVGTKSYAKYNASGNYWELSETPNFTKVERNLNKNVATFTIQDQNYTGNLQYMHINNSAAGETGVMGWEPAADATNFYFVEQPDQQADQIDVNALVLNFEKEKANTIIASYSEGKDNYIGSYREEDIRALQALLEKTNVTADEIQTQIETTIAGAKKPEAGKFYYIQNTMAFNDGGTKGIYENPDGSNIAWHSATQGAAELWQLVDNGEGKYYIKSANTGKYMKLNVGDPTATMVADQISAFALEQKDNNITLGLVNYNNNDRTTLVLQNGSTWGSVATAENESGSYVGSYNDFSATRPTKWNIIEANTIKVMIGETQYATLWLPYAVSLNGTGVEAYTIGSITDGNATLNPIEGDIIPAQSAVILYGTAGSYDFTIVADDTQEAVESSLQGTAIATDINADINAYVLGYGEQGIGFYQMSEDDRIMEANKAYLALPASMSAIRSITIGGPTTGIENTVAEGAVQEEYYDLQGRRVMNPTKGIYVTKSGKKVVLNK